ncbi:MAG TPA: OmpA family protein [Candidatus Kapabacteria bacterium]|nr:OmpA family protein [Candidatus Kapabacteria bacterium]
MAQRLIAAASILLLAVGLAGCPQHVINIAREVTPPKDYKPVYMTSTIPYDQMVKALKSGARPATPSRDSAGNPHGGSTIDSRTSGAETGAASGPLLMDIRAVDDSRYPDQVELRAFVYDTSGRFVMGLAPPYFNGPGTWRDDWSTLVDSCSGERTTIDSFSVTEVREDRREPYAIAFVLDQSGSMGDEKVRRLRTAVSRTLRIIKQGDQITAVKFGSACEVDVPLTGDSSRFRHEFQIENLEPPGGGGTALYDAAIVGINEVAKAPPTHRRAVILFTDGMDGNSHAAVDAVHRIAREKKVTLYTVAYGEANEEVMRNMAVYTGGRMYRIYSNKEFPYVFADIYRGLSNYYRITYHPPLCKGIHTATASLTLAEVGCRLAASGLYDRSLFMPYDPVGSIALVGIEFDYDKASISSGSMPRIREVADAMRSNPDIKLEIRGHTDDRGGDDYNMKLSQDRAQAVANAIVAMGIDAGRLSVKGFGKTRPLVPNDSEENRQKNRRTEFVIVSRGK